MVKMGLWPECKKNSKGSGSICCVCEFGPWDGKHLSNTFYLVEKGYRSVLLKVILFNLPDCEILQTNLNVSKQLISQLQDSTMMRIHSIIFFK